MYRQWCGNRLSACGSWLVGERRFTDRWPLAAQLAKSRLAVCRPPQSGTYISDVAIQVVAAEGWVCPPVRQSVGGRRAGGLTETGKLSGRGVPEPHRLRFRLDLTVPAVPAGAPLELGPSGQQQQHARKRSLANSPMLTRQLRTSSGSPPPCSPVLGPTPAHPG